MSGICRKAFTEQLFKRAKEDSLIYALCTDSRGSVTLEDFAEELPGQFVELGIAEQNCVGVAAGLANAGLKPFVAGPACFYSMRSAEQVKIDIAYSNSNVKIIGISGGVSYGALGMSHHSLQDIAMMTAIPGLTVILPADAWQTRCMTDYIIDVDKTPAYIRMGRGPVNDVYGPNGISGLSPRFKTGKAIKLMDGEDVLMIAAGEMVFPCYEVAMKLNCDGISVCMLDMHTLNPLDKDAILENAKNVKLVVTAEEHSINGGLGALVANVLCESIPKKMKKFALPNENMVTGTSREVFAHYGLTSENMFDEIKKILKSGI